MTNLSNKEAALLGLLSEKPKHAYEIKNDIKERDMHYWTEISTSSIYKLLNKLEDRGFLTSETKISSKNVVQKVYTLTVKGHEAFIDKIKELLSDWQPSIHPIDISLANMNLLESQQAMEGLSNYAESLDKQIQCYKELENYLIESNCPLGNIQLATRRIYMLKGEKEWAQDYLEKMKTASDQ